MKLTPKLLARVSVVVGLAALAGACGSSLAMQKLGSGGNGEGSGGHGNGSGSGGGAGIGGNGSGNGSGSGSGGRMVGTGGEGGSAQVATGGSPGAGSGGGTVVPGCPLSIPTNGGGCAPDALVCTYGESSRADCRDQALCNGGKWLIVASACPAPLSQGCPINAPAVGDMPQCTAAQVDSYCEYATGNGVLCKCVGNASGGVFVCNRPTPPAPPCPPTVPNSGTLCGNTLMACVYPCAGQLWSTAVTATCSNHIWTWAFMSCTSAG